MSNMSPTGRWRHRSERRWGRERLILQIEERFLHTFYGSGMIDSDWATRWRDAETSDLASPTACVEQLGVS